VKELVANLSPDPARTPSSIIQMASAKGVINSAILYGTFLIPFEYQTSCRTFKLE